MQAERSAETKSSEEQREDGAKTWISHTFLAIRWKGATNLARLFSAYTKKYHWNITAAFHPTSVWNRLFYVDFSKMAHKKITIIKTSINHMAIDALWIQYSMSIKIPKHSQHSPATIARFSQQSTAIIGRSPATCDDVKKAI